MFENKKVGLALSGGGAKGASHIGVLQALKEAGVDIFAISGTSSGSIVATLYASGYSPYQILKLFKIYSNQIINLDSKVLIKMFTKSFGNRSNFASIASGINLESVIKMNLKYKNITSIKDIKMPIIIIIIIMIFIIAMIWSWYNLGYEEKKTKIVFIVISTISMYLITLIAFNISNKWVNYQESQNYGIFRNILVLLFASLNTLVIIPYFAKNFEKVKEKEMEKNEFVKRIVILLVVFILCLIWEVG